MIYDKYETSDTMSAFFKGKVNINDLNNRPKSRTVELGYGKGIGHIHGSYSEYIKKLREQTPKGNGIISIGKSVTDKNNIFSMPNITDKFAVGDVPHILIMYYNIINPMAINVSWKNSEDGTISEQYHNIPASHSLNYDWWEQYGVYFIGPEDLEEGDYEVNVTSTEFDRGNNVKNLSTSLDFKVVDA